MSPSVVLAVDDATHLQVSSATFAQLNKQVLLTRGLKFRPGDPLHVKTFDNMADEEVPTFFIEMVREIESRERE